MADLSTLYCSVTEAYNAFEKAALACNIAQMVSLKRAKCEDIAHSRTRVGFRSCDSLLMIQMINAITTTKQLKFHIIISKEMVNRNYKSN